MLKRSSVQEDVNPSAPVNVDTLNPLFFEAGLESHSTKIGTKVPRCSNDHFPVRATLAGNLESEAAVQRNDIRMTDTEQPSLGRFIFNPFRRF